MLIQLTGLWSRCRQHFLRPGLAVTPGLTRKSSRKQIRIDLKPGPNTSISPFYVNQKSLVIIMLHMASVIVKRSKVYIMGVCLSGIGRLKSQRRHRFLLQWYTMASSKLSSKLLLPWRFNFISKALGHVRLFFYYSFVIIASCIYCEGQWVLHTMAPHIPLCK